ncbi:hypothetical protein [Variovorax ginsengisoli]|uniref:Uncharacterized protein n=1 Tax=Variovorax ginsengisoli TaxID=363844 RepID=A0ABT9SF11_9BURK|nr:hypothetical protein [Variovorax ginsengisoli]MDP9902951.1 hypothetical protein [Variovorax ginsengisoli]
MNPTASTVTTLALPHPTLLRIPTWYSDLAHDEVVLPLPPEDYNVQEVGKLWRVTISGTDEFVYLGSGPVEVVRSRAPF